MVAHSREGFHTTCFADHDDMRTIRVCQDHSRLVLY